MKGFVRKKVQSSTLGERLKMSRLDRRISLNEASKATKIQSRYLENLENGEYSKLPADVYTRGFLRNYASYLGLSPNKVVALFDKEKGIQRNIRKDSGEEKKEKKVKVSRFIITPKIIGVITISLIVFFAFFYLYSEFDDFVSTPRLVIKHPLQTHESISDSHIYFEGVTDKDNEVTINGRKVLVNDEGVFSDDISLQRGVNSIVVRAINRFGKESKKEYFINSDSVVDSDVLGEEKKEFEVEIEADEELINVTVREGEKSVYSGAIHPGFSQKITVSGSFSISSDNGAGTKVIIDGEDKGSLGEVQEQVENFVFNLD
jgi:cytoskeletal protein RodZ